MAMNMAGPFTLLKRLFQSGKAKVETSSAGQHGDRIPASLAVFDKADECSRRCLACTVKLWSAVLEYQPDRRHKGVEDSLPRSKARKESRAQSRLDQLVADYKSETASMFTNNGDEMEEGCELFRVRSEVAELIGITQDQLLQYEEVAWVCEEEEIGVRGLQTVARLIDVHRAARMGDEWSVQLVIEHAPTRVDIPDALGRTPLRVAAAFGHLTCAELLLGAGAYVNEAGEDGKTPLMQACSKGHIDMIATLIQGNALLDQTDADGRTALHIAAYYGFETAVKILVNHGADANYVDSEGQTSVHMSALGSTETPRNLTQRPVKRLMSGDLFLSGLKALYDDTKSSRSGIIEALILGGANVNYADMNGMTPLHYAAVAGEEEIVLALLAGKADTSMTTGRDSDVEGQTALDLARNADHSAVLKLLRNQLDEGPQQAPNDPTDVKGAETKCIDVSSPSKHLNTVPVKCSSSEKRVTFDCRPSLISADEHVDDAFEERLSRASLSSSMLLPNRDERNNLDLGPSALPRII